MSYSMFDGFTLDVAIPDGFKDSSYHNDAMPSWTKVLTQDTEHRLVIWIDYADQSMSEVGGCRFTLEHYFEDGSCVCIEHSDNWQDILVELVMFEIIDLINADIVPFSIRSFAELHDYCDANMLGGMNDDMDVINAVTDKVNGWLMKGLAK